MKRYPPIVCAVVLTIVLATSCARLKWASYGDMPWICCGGPSGWVEHVESPTFQQASLEYLQTVNLPGGCANPQSKVGQLEREIEILLGAWQFCPNDCRGDFSATVSKLLKRLNSETYKAGPMYRSTHGAPCTPKVITGKP